MNRAPLSKRCLATAVLGLAAATTFATLCSAQSTATTPPDMSEVAGGDRRALIDGGESPDLFLMYTGDVIGYLDPCG